MYQYRNNQIERLNKNQQMAEGKVEKWAYLKGPKKKGGKIQQGLPL